MLLLDPGPDPLVQGMALPRLQVLYGLRYGGFTPGSVLWDPVYGVKHTVCRRGIRWVLDPPSPRIDRSGKKRKGKNGNAPY